MRYSRLKRRRAGQRYISLIITVLLISGVIYIGSASTIGKYIGNKIAPIFSSFAKNHNNNFKNGDEPAITIPTDTDKKEEKITEIVNAEPLQLTAIQIGAFQDNSNAENEAEMLQKTGGAGYVLEEDYYRVFAMGYLDENDANRVKNQLKEEGIDSVLYTIKASGASMEITAGTDNVETIKTTFSEWIDKFNSMEELIVDLDTKKVSSDDAWNRIKDYKSSLNKINDKLKDIATSQEDNKVLAALVDLYTEGIMSFDRILTADSSKLVEISSKMKYTYINMIILYKNFMKTILTT